MYCLKNENKFVVRKQCFYNFHSNPCSNIITLRSDNIINYFVKRLVFYNNGVFLFRYDTIFKATIFNCLISHF